MLLAPDLQHFLAFQVWSTPEALLLRFSLGLQHRPLLLFHVAVLGLSDPLADADCGGELWCMVAL